MPCHQPGPDGIDDSETKCGDQPKCANDPSRHSCEPDNGATGQSPSHLPPLKRLIFHEPMVSGSKTRSYPGSHADVGRPERTTSNLEHSGRRSRKLPYDRPTVHRGDGCAFRQHLATQLVEDHSCWMTGKPQFSARLPGSLKDAAPKRKYQPAMRQESLRRRSSSSVLFVAKGRWTAFKAGLSRRNTPHATDPRRSAAPGKSGRNHHPSQP